MKICKNYTTRNAPLAEECAERSGRYEDHEIQSHFWKDRTNSDGYWTICKHCKWLERNTIEHRPTITKDWPRDKNGRLLSYWHIIDNAIILKGREE